MRSDKSTLLTQADGIRLAVDMLLEMSRLGLDQLAIDAADARDGRPQSDVLARFLTTAQRSPAVKAGFLAVLTDVLGSYAEGRAGEGLAEFFEKAT